MLGGGHPVVLGANAPSHPSSNGELAEPLVKKPKPGEEAQAGDHLTELMPRLTARGLRLKRQCRSCARRVRSRPGGLGAAQVKTSSGAPGADARLSAAACAAGGRAIAGALRGRRPARRAQAPRATRGSMPAIVPSIDRREPGRLFGTVVAGAFDDHEERPRRSTARCRDGGAHLGLRPRVRRTGGRAPVSRCRRPGAGSRRLGDAASTVGQAH